MKGKMLTATAYPPPPPPPPPKGSRNMLVIAVVVIIIVVAVVAGVYFITAKPGSTTNPTPTPSATPTATPTSSPNVTPTPTPTGNNPAVNFRAGTWAQYVIKTYGEGGAVTAENTMKYSLDEGTYSGTACWLLTYEMTMNEDSDTIKTVMTYWMNKNTLEGIHVKTQMYTNNELTYEHEEDITPGEGDGDIPEPIDMTTVTSYETVTVPAGTFNCGKITVTTPTGTTSSWANSDIPILGLVKMESTSGGAVTQTTELTDYSH